MDSLRKMSCPFSVCFPQTASFPRFLGFFDDFLDDFLDDATRSSKGGLPSQRPFLFFLKPSGHLDMMRGLAPPSREAFTLRVWKCSNLYFHETVYVKISILKFQLSNSLKTFVFCIFLLLTFPVSISGFPLSFVGAYRVFSFHLKNFINLFTDIGRPLGERRVICSSLK